MQADPALSVECPCCGAAVGKVCHWAYGSSAHGTTHLTRVEKAMQAVQVQRHGVLPEQEACLKETNRLLEGIHQVTTDQAGQSREAARRAEEAVRKATQRLKEWARQEATVGKLPAWRKARVFVNGELVFECDNVVTASVEFLPS